ncbi:MAG: hypothetical protein JO285_14895, partial [Kutzneria sp.]|nr:hypothetical protein [Kutzneria sp.]
MRVRGVGQVLAFNWPKVVAGAATSTAAFTVANWLPRRLRPVVRCGGAVAAWFTTASIVAS